MAKKVWIDKQTGIWDIEVAKKRHRFDENLVSAIMTIYSPQKVADLGCGNGRYCKYFKENGWSTVHGYEGTQDIKELGIYDDIMIVDLSKRRYVCMDYDFVLCLEVGEHIPKEHEQVFLDNVCEYVNKDLVISWAVPGQGGAGHFNEQPLQYIIKEMDKREMIFNRSQSEYLREASTLKWFKHTIMCFRRL